LGSGRSDESRSALVDSDNNKGRKGRRATMFSFVVIESRQGDSSSVSVKMKEQEYYKR
jgi:hypothetical protein